MCRRAVGEGGVEGLLGGVMMLGVGGNVIEKLGVDGAICEAVSPTGVA